MKLIISLIFIFSLIFDPLIAGIGATYLVGVTSTIFIICLGKLNSLIRTFYFNKFFVTILLIPFALISYSIIISFTHFTYDVTIIKTFVNQIICFSCTINTIFFIYIYVLDSKYDLHNIIVAAFVLQSVIMILAFSSSSFADFVRMFQGPDLQRLKHSYGGIRTLMLANTAFYGLGATYGFVFMYNSFRISLIERKITIINVLVYIGLIAGICLVARTGFIGVLLGIVFLFYKSNIKMFFSFFMYVFALFLLLLIVLPDYFLDLFIKKIAPFAFEFLVNKNKMSTSSTNELMSMWQIPISIQTFFFGDGLYTGSDGAYYMKTDVGYLRNILFGGILFFISIFCYQLYFILVPLKSWYNSQVSKYDLRKIGLLILTYFLILHIKGESLGFLKTLLVTYLCFISNEYLIYKKNIEK